MSRSSNKAIGITLGDPSGIGPEVVVKAIRNSQIRRLPKIVIVGDGKVLRRYSAALPANCFLLDLQNVDHGKWRVGQPQRLSAKASLEYLDKAVLLIKSKQIGSLVTAPVCKETIQLLGMPFVGHTEYLARQFGVKQFGMMFVSSRLRTMLVTRHIPLAQVSRSINSSNIFACIRLAHDALKNFFKIRQPIIAVCGLNPHSGEGGMIGQEEITKILPAIRKARKKGIRILGPLAGDTAFTPKVAQEYDLIVAMYHDQGLIAPKSLDWSGLVNLTVGLPFIRTSPAHGTAFNIAGKNQADPRSMIEAIKLAAKFS